MKKDFIKGFIVSALLFGMTNVFAANYNAITATFPILVNNQVFTTDKPIVTINGSTYLPLKSLGDALNVSVIWNNQLNQVEITTISNSSTQSNVTLHATENNYSSIPNSISYIGNKNTKKLHISTCSAAKKMSTSNKVYFTSKSEAIGYVACKICNP